MKGPSTDEQKGEKEKSGSQSWQKKKRGAPIRGGKKKSRPRREKATKERELPQQGLLQKFHGQRRCP